MSVISDLIIHFDPMDQVEVSLELMIYDCPVPSGSLALDPEDYLILWIKLVSLRHPPNALGILGGSQNQNYVH